MTDKKIHELALKVSEREGGKVQTNIAQIKEIIKCIEIEMALDSDLAADMIENGMRHVEELGGFDV